MGVFSQDLLASMPVSALKQVKAKFLPMLQWVWGFGTKTSHYFILSLTIMTYSCTSTDEQKEDTGPSFEESSQDDENNSFSDEDNSLDDDEENLESTNNDYPIKHPKDSSPWTLKTMIMTAQKPADDDLIRCNQEILAISKETFNESGILVAKEKIFNDVNQLHSRYHWCFYFSIVTLNNKLKGDGLGKELKTRLKNFHLEMKSILVLASTLDQVKQSSVYMTYARKRYMEISKIHFARELMAIPGSGSRGGKTKGKPAGHFE